MLGSTRRLEAQVNSGGGVELIPEKNDFFIFFHVTEIAENSWAP
jgi:hypothetical protein